VDDQHHAACREGFRSIHELVAPGSLLEAVPDQVENLSHKTCIMGDFRDPEGASRRDP